MSTTETGITFPWQLPLLLIVLVLLVYLYGIWTFSTWSRLGIPGPRPSAFVGNLGDFQSKGFLASFEEWRKTYGKTYGIYFTRQPVLVTTDPAILKEVMVKQFHNFTDRHFITAELTQDYFRSNLFLSGGDTWRRYRLAMAPSFTSGKLKAVMTYITNCCQTLTSVLEQNAKAEDIVDLKDLYQRFTMDVIAGTALGLETKMLTDKRPEQQQMLSAMNEVFASTVADSLPVRLVGIFPALEAPLRWLGFVAIPPNAASFFKTLLDSLIRQRDIHPTDSHKRVDFLQQLLDLRVRPGQHVHDVTEEPFGKKPTKLLTQQEVVSQCFNIALAGFETTASALRFLTYHLAIHQDVQDKVLAEIQQVIGEEEISYEHLAELKYLDCVILETLRMYPSTPLIGRRAASTATVNGVTIPPGASVFIPIYAATHDPTNYPEPHLFKPERFETVHQSILSLLPFGLGPRQCIGMRLALLEIKMAVAHVLPRIQFAPCDLTPANINFTNRLLLLPTVPICVSAKLRT
ncbi:cytochrome P450 3A43-like [Pomacea canaliculata]|uniref:cytochrome P450 3A43-like n=1 Tax=Pomacea canaliculata TaxID=400727 RepID=UPI000D73D90E|nr:cytochrome P450 3A43-like [Pomacea canaliculata]